MLQVAQGMLELINLCTKTRMLVMSETVMLLRMFVSLDPIHYSNKPAVLYADNTNALHCNYEKSTLSLTCLAPLPSTSAPLPSTK